MAPYVIFICFCPVEWNGLMSLITPRHTHWIWNLRDAVVVDPCTHPLTPLGGNLGHHVCSHTADSCLYTCTSHTNYQWLLPRVLHVMVSVVRAIAWELPWTVARLQTDSIQTEQAGAALFLPHQLQLSVCGSIWSTLVAKHCCCNCCETQCCGNPLLL